MSNNKSVAKKVFIPIVIVTVAVLGMLFMIATKMTKDIETKKI
jgi:hypothetical protein